MGLFNSNASWTNQAKGSGGFFHPEKKCPPVNDCDVKKFVGSRRKPTAKQRRDAAKLAREQKKARKEAAAAKKASRQRSWPNAGKYTPKK